MKKVISVIVFFVPLIVSAQKFNVVSKDNKSREFLMEKIKSEGLDINLNSSDYTVEVIIEGGYNPVSFKGSHEGYIIVRRTTSGEEIGRSKTYNATPAGINGYNASYVITKKASKKELVQLLQKCK